MAKRKRARCPFCGLKKEDPKYNDKRYLDFFIRDIYFSKEEDKWLPCWSCSNCSYTKPIGKPKSSPKKRAEMIENIRKSLSKIQENSKHCFEYNITIEELDNGDIYVSVDGQQAKGTLLGSISWRLIGIRITANGGLTVYSDSKLRDKKDKKYIKMNEKDLRRGREFYW